MLRDLSPSLSLSRAQVVHQGRFQMILFRITLILLALCLLMCAIIFVKLLLTPDSPADAAAGGSKFMRSLSVVIVILVASIPIAIEVVCTSTLAVGSRRLAQKKVIVARLSAIEELAGMTILCSDKTGTLTLNKLSLREPIILGDMNEKEIIFYCAYRAGRESGEERERGRAFVGATRSLNHPAFYPPPTYPTCSRAGLQARGGQPGRHRLLHHAGRAQGGPVRSSSRCSGSARRRAGPTQAVFQWRPEIAPHSARLQLTFPFVAPPSRPHPSLPLCSARLAAFKEVDFVPFNPTDKRTEATIQAPDGSVFKVTKGAPQVIMRLAHNAAALREKVTSSVQDLADRGFRSLGVAISYTGVGEQTHWEYQGILSLFDPPRPDTKATIAAAIANGIEVKMVTGDQTAIAKETCRELGMGTNILNTEVLNDKSMSQAAVDEIILNSHGFAEVMVRVCVGPRGGVGSGGAAVPAAMR
jgi:magnesium-transporting ATPase (P-type)